MTETCGHEHYTLGKDRVCVRPAGHEPPHRDVDGVIWQIFIPEIPERKPTDF